jgi:hypothetical protein
MRYDGGGLDDCVWCGGLLGEGIGTVSARHSRWLVSKLMPFAVLVKVDDWMELRSILMIGL